MHKLIKQLFVYVCFSTVLWNGVILRQARATPVAAPPSVPDSIMKFTIRAEDWGFSSLSQIHTGQLGLLRHGKKDELIPYMLRAKSLRPTVSMQVARSQVPTHTGHCYLVSHFDQGSTNRLGGYYNRFYKPPSSAEAGIRANKQGDHALILRYTREKAGYCGVWMHFFNFKKALHERHYLDSTGYSYLTFWIRGTQGGEQIWLKVADALWETKGDALGVGRLHEFMVSRRIATHWQPVVIPLSRLPTQLDRKKLASLVWEALDGKGQIEIKTLALCRHTQDIPQPLLAAVSGGIAQATKSGLSSTTLTTGHTVSSATGKQKTSMLASKQVSNSPTSSTLPTPKTSPSHRPVVVLPLRRATWLWNTKPYLQSVRKQRELIAWLTKHGFDAIFIQIPHQSPKLLQQEPSALNTTLWRPLIAALHRHQIKVFALDGYKKYALPTWHSRVMQVVHRVIAYNQQVFSHEMFDGVHLDIEPYLMSSHWTSRRVWLMSHYLGLLWRIKTLLHQHGMTLGADIPFWWDEKDPHTQQVFQLTFQGKQKPLHEHVIDIVDRIGIMDYRTEAFGADGVVVHATQELQYASRVGKQVLIGLETLPLPHEFLLDFRGTPQSGFPQEPYSAESYVFLIASPTTPRPVNAAATPSSVNVGQLAWVPRTQLPFWKQSLDKEQISSKDTVFWPVHRTQYVSPDKLSFANLGFTQLHLVLKQLQPVLQRYSAFTGFAIHSFHSYQTLVRKHASSAKPSKKEEP